MKLNSNYILSVETLRSSSIIKYLLFLCLVGLLLSAYWPGSMMWDSFEQYRQAVSHKYEDWHPPYYGMGLSWSIFLIIRSIHVVIPFYYVFWSSNLTLYKLC